MSVVIDPVFNFSDHNYGLKNYKGYVTFVIDTITNTGRHFLQRKKKSKLDAALSFFKLQTAT